MQIYRSLPSNHCGLATWSIDSITRLRSQKQSTFNQVVVARCELVKLTALSIAEFCVHTVTAAAKITTAVVQIPLAPLVGGVTPRVALVDAGSHLVRAVKIATVAPFGVLLGVVRPEWSVDVYQRLSLVEPTGRLACAINRLSSAAKAAWASRFRNYALAGAAAAVATLVVRSYLKAPIPSGYSWKTLAAGALAVVGVGFAGHTGVKAVQKRRAAPFLDADYKIQRLTPDLYDYYRSSLFYALDKFPPAHFHSGVVSKLTPEAKHKIYSNFISVEDGTPYIMNLMNRNELSGPDLVDMISWIIGQSEVFHTDQQKQYVGVMRDRFVKDINDRNYHDTSTAANFAWANLQRDTTQFLRNDFIQEISDKMPTDVDLVAKWLNGNWCEIPQGTNKNVDAAKAAWVKRQSMSPVNNVMLPVMLHVQQCLQAGLSPKQFSEAICSWLNPSFIPSTPEEFEDANLAVELLCAEGLNIYTSPLMTNFAAPPMHLDQSGRQLKLKGMDKESFYRYLSQLFDALSELDPKKLYRDRTFAITPQNVFSIYQSFLTVENQREFILSGVQAQHISEVDVGTMIKWMVSQWYIAGTPQYTEIEQLFSTMQAEKGNSEEAAKGLWKSLERNATFQTVLLPAMKHVRWCLSDEFSALEMPKVCMDQLATNVVITSAEKLAPKQVFEFSAFEMSEVCMDRLATNVVMTSAEKLATRIAFELLCKHVNKLDLDGMNGLSTDPKPPRKDAII